MVTSRSDGITHAFGRALAAGSSACCAPAAPGAGGASAEAEEEPLATAMTWQPPPPEPPLRVRLASGLIRAARHTFFVFSMTGGVMPSTPVPAQTPASDPTVSKADGDLHQPNHSRWESSEQWRAQMSVCYERPVTERRAGRTYPMRTPTCCIESIATSSYDGSSSVWTVT